MFLVNTRKCLDIFDRVYVSSDSDEILAQARSLGAIPISRGEDLCGDVPNIPVYKHAIKKMINVDAIVAVQSNSPTIEKNIITMVKKIMELGAGEVMTCAADYSVYGSVWALRADRLMTYGDPYRPKPDILVVDKSIDIHTESDYVDALKASL